MHMSLYRRVADWRTVQRFFFLGRRPTIKGSMLTGRRTCKTGCPDLVVPSCK